MVQFEFLGQNIVLVCNEMIIDDILVNETISL